MSCRPLALVALLATAAIPASLIAQETKADKDAAKLEEERGEIRSMAAKALAELYQKNPSAKADVEKAAGYGVFSELNITLGPATGGGGRGMVVNRATGKDTFMRMAEAGGGIGIGVKEFRAIFVFDSKEALDKFVTKGWNFGGDADATAKAAGEGGSANAAFSVGEGIRLYQLTKGGLALKATVSGTKYWKDEKLN